MNRRANFDAASYIIGGKIRNRTNTHTYTQSYKKTNSKRYINKHLAYISMCG